MAPLAADMMKIVEKCGDDEACLAQEVQEYSSGEGVHLALKAKKAAEPDIAAVLQRGPKRYQLWMPAAPGSRTFNIRDERQERWSSFGLGFPTVHCTSGAVDVGEGRLVPLVVANAPKGMPLESGAIQFDSKAKTLTLSPPGVLGTPSPPLKRTHGGNCSDVATTKGVSLRGITFPSLNTGLETGPWLINLNGEQVAQQGSRNVGGKSTGNTLTIRWSLQPL